MRAYVAGLDYLRNNRFGTVFGGNSQIGITIDELMKREAQR
jgi:phosphate transport system substrate-binding protein